MARKLRKAAASAAAVPAALAARVWRCAVYARLSCRNNGLADDGSLRAQVDFVRDSLSSMEGVEVVGVYEDNGRTGTTFEGRAAFDALMDEVRAGAVDCIAVKDLSRLGPRTKSRTKLGPGGSPMYTKEEREGILWEYHRSGMSVPEACRLLPLFPTRSNLYRWLRMEEAGELAAAEMPRRAERMHCSHGEGSPRYAARRPRAEREGAAMADAPEQADWRDWGSDLPEEPAERARMAEARLAEALAVLDVLKAPGPASLTGEERWRAGELARGVPAREARERDRDALDTQEHLPRPGREGR